MTEVRLPAPVKAVAVENAFDHARFGEDDGRAGVFTLEQAPPDRKGFWGWIVFTCPCGCGSMSRLPIGLNEKPPQGVDPGGVKATWQWDGNREAPTLSPSIHHIGHWHGYLRAGFWTQA